jgi:hypothetical protein
MSLSSMSTGPRTLLVGIALVSVYIGYAKLTQPWLKVERNRPVLPRTTAPQEKSPVFAEEASNWFREDPWVREANGRFRDGGRLLFFEKHEFFNENRSIRVEPIAMMWRNDKSEQPFTVTADSAQLDSSKRFSFSEGQFGKITSGLLTGDFRVTGPDNLRIEGTMLHISEDAMKVWTNQPVTFVWDTHSGRAEGGAEIDLIASADASRDGLLAVSDVESIRLLGRIHCNLMFLDEDAEDEPVHMTVSAANGFEFFMPTRQATFSGFTDRAQNLDNQVLVQRHSTDGRRDLLHCSRLGLQFQPQIREAGSGESNRPELTMISAEGQPVRYLARKGNEELIYAEMRTLRYLIKGKQLELIEGVDASDGRSTKVHLHQGGSELTTGYLLVMLDDDNEVRSIKCLGPGQIGRSGRSRNGRGKDESSSIDSSWSESLTLLRGDEQKITLQGQANIFHPHSGMGLSGNQIAMLLTGSPEIPRDTAVADSDEDPAQDLDLSRLRPRKLVASGGVQLNAPGVSGTGRDRLTVTFQDDRTSDVTANPAATPSRKRSVSTVSRTSATNASDSGEQTTFTSDTIEVLVELADGADPSFRDLWLKGNVTVNHDSNNTERRFTAACNVLNAREGFGASREITLFGDPATIVNASNRIEGKQIELGESGSARVEGSGRIRYVVNTGLNGDPLSRPSPLDIYWGDHMSVSGRTAHFVGNIRAIMKNEEDHDVEVTCAGMKIHFSREITLQRDEKTSELRIENAEDSRSPAGEIELIECESRVVVDIRLMEKGVVTSRHHAEFSDLTFNQTTGEFHATGPGMIESAQPDTGKRLSASNRVIAKSNSPTAASDSQYVFIHATFIGELSGNRTTRFVQLRQHVRGLFGPVRELDNTIQIDGLTVEEFPENTGSLECENLSISEIIGAEGQPNSFSLVAETNAAGKQAAGTRSPCRIESRLFSGNADKIKYDHSKQQFVLSAEENRQATVSWRRDGGAPESLTGGNFLYFHETNQLKVTHVRAVQASEF